MGHQLKLKLELSHHSEGSAIGITSSNLSTSCGSTPSGTNSSDRKLKLKELKTLPVEKKLAYRLMYVQ